MDCVPVAGQRDGQQRRRHDEQSSGLERVHVMPVPALRSLIHRGVSMEHIVAPDRSHRNERIYQANAWLVIAVMFHVEHCANHHDITIS